MKLTAEEKRLLNNATLSDLWDFQHSEFAHPNNGWIQLNEDFIKFLQWKYSNPPDLGISISETTQTSERIS